MTAALGATSFALGLKPPYYAVVFSSQRTEGDNGYGAMGDRMVELAAGYLGVESVRGTDGFGVTVSYWQSEVAISQWKANAEHLEAQKLGWNPWYAHFEMRIAKVERSYAMIGRKPP
jgi:heme-degrading monooxygenase HmoA